MKKKIGKLAHAFRVEDGKKFHLKDYDPAETGDWRSKEHAAKSLAEGVERTVELQDMLYAQDKWALLLIFQAMDAAGKDGAIKHVMSGVNPQGCQVHSFKAPSEIELQHDFLWRTTRDLPERGHIGIFNRSYYEEVLVVRVHPDILKSQKVPPSLVGKNIWQQRFEDICCFERHMARSGTVIRKFFLHVSKKEQKKRFLDRLDEPEKNWKFSVGDIHERKYWDEYQDAYEDMVRNTATKDAPWFVVPADNKWFTRLVISSVIVDTLESLKLAYPKVDEAEKKQLQEGRKVLESKS
ncbi:MAG TPA: polyphosphate kinase 2 family protein [Candidatus Sulfotelmatobacter sp.]|nr:polyphosphate kinase 2 family protein [Candidatus Sulfotelmatobacter sp.]